jgi:hypothetical protein
MANLPDAWVEDARNLDNAEQSTMQSQNSIERSPPETTDCFITGFVTSPTISGVRRLAAVGRRNMGSDPLSRV